MMKKLIFILFIFFAVSGLRANDGGFYGNGNQLIPIHETTITVKKEVLKIIRSREKPEQVNISVYYEFYNPGEAKTMTVGFEAASPSGDADTSPDQGEQPYLHGFTVEMNSKKLPYKVAIVDDKVYKAQGIIKNLSDKEIEENTGDGWADFMYVYHFEADFKKGLNIIKHTYTYDLSTFVMSNYVFGYQLSPAMRWGNKQIDDFTLHMDMGDDQLIVIPKTFYDNVNDWAFTGRGKMKDSPHPYDYLSEDKSKKGFGKFYIKEGYMVFRKQNFKPEGELHLSSPRTLYLENFNYKVDTELIAGIMHYTDPDYIQVADDMSRKVLKNLPFAMRGYIFSTPEIQQFYENQIWYFPDPDYKADFSGLKKEEQDWVRYWN